MQIYEIFVHTMKYTESQPRTPLSEVSMWLVAIKHEDDETRRDGYMIGESQGATYKQTKVETETQTQQPEDIRIDGRASQRRRQREGGTCKQRKRHGKVGERAGGRTDRRTDRQAGRQAS
jgi:hypothetical protein